VSERRHTSVALILTLALASPLLADSHMAAAPYAYTALPDTKQEAEARDLMGEIRCVVCQGQSIIDSNADLAADMRSMIRQRIQKGEQPAAIRAWLIARYGKWVSYDPPLAFDTAPLWLLPLALLGLGIWLLAGRLKWRRS